MSSSTPQVSPPPRSAAPGTIPRDIYRAVKLQPITGLPGLDAKLMHVTAHLESSGRDVKVHKGSSATGYYGLTNGARSDMRSAVGKPFSRDLFTQTLYAAAYYRWLLTRLSKNPSLVRQYSTNPYLNTYLNIRHRFVSGLGTAQLNHPHAKAAVKKALPFAPYIMGADVRLTGSPSAAFPRNLKFMSPHLADEFSQLPLSVRSATFSICSMMPEGEVWVSSVKTSYNGAKRTPANGPNHYQFRAVDIVPAPSGWGPMYKDQAGSPRSPHFNWNQELIAHLKAKFAHRFPCAIALESDHIHIDDTHDPGLYTYSSHRSSYPNDAVTMCSKHVLHRIA